MSVIGDKNERHQLEKVFDVPIERTARGSLDWPTAAQLETDSGLGGNREYRNLTDFTWSDYAEAASVESKLVAHLHTLSVEDRGEFLEEFYEADDGLGDSLALEGLDPGVASTVIALSAANCAPYVSCNAGAFSEAYHPEHYPLVCFFARSVYLPPLLECAARAGVGLILWGGGLKVYGRTILSMMRFGEELSICKDKFFLPATSPDDQGALYSSDQLDLFKG